MGFDTGRKDVETRFQNYWGTTTEVLYDNMTRVPERGTPWVRLTINEGQSNIIGIADTNLYRNLGVIIVQVFVPEGQGTASARQLADQAAAIFRGAQFGSGITCRAPQLANIGVIDGWYQINVSVPFFRDEYF